MQTDVILTNKLQTGYVMLLRLTVVIIKALDSTTKNINFWTGRDNIMAIYSGGKDATIISVGSDILFY